MNPHQESRLIYDRMLAPRRTKLRSQRDINLWRIPLQLALAAVALFGITMTPDILDKYGVIRIPWWMTMGSIDGLPHCGHVGAVSETWRPQSGHVMSAMESWWGV
jgi:hypothetical protein